MTLINILGGLAALCSTASFFPQAWKILRTRDTTSISARMYGISVTGFSLWLAYGILLGQWPLILTNSICWGLSALILVMKLIPDERLKRPG